MKRYLLVAFVVLAVTPGAASSQMMGGGMGDGASAQAGMAQQGAKSEMSPAGMGGGMMGQCKEMMGGGMMSGGMMSGAMMGAEMMAPVMPSMMDGMMPGKARGCMMMAEGMMRGQMDMAQMRKTLALSDEQSEKMRAGLRPLQKEAILTLASLKVAELELADLLAGAKVDFGKVEAKLKEIEAMRTNVRLAHLKAAEAVKGVLSKEQLEQLQKAVESTPVPAPAAPAPPQQGAAPPSGEEHELHH